jgi:uncharacterized protein (TIGR02996 family)
VKDVKKDGDYPALYYVDGLLVSQPIYAPFLLSVLENPGEETTRLVFADCVEENDGPNCERFASLLRVHGSWMIDARPQHRDIGAQQLCWAVHSMERPFLISCCGVSAIVMPECKTCGHKPYKDDTKGLFVQDGFWKCSGGCRLARAAQRVETTQNRGA